MSRRLGAAHLVALGVREDVVRHVGDDAVVHAGTRLLSVRRAAHGRSLREEIVVVQRLALDQT